jgi:hypothetical protein
VRPGVQRRGLMMLRQGVSRQSSRVRDDQIDAIGIKYVGPVQSGIAF